MYKTFDDYLIKPTYSKINSRSDVDTSITIMGDLELRVPILSANMETITGVKMANKLGEYGGVGVLHRFCTIEENVKMYEQCEHPTIVSLGLDYERYLALQEAGAKYFCIDVAHGAQRQVANFINKIYDPDLHYMVGNFATKRSITEFEKRLEHKVRRLTYKIGIGPGSACETRNVAGVGVPQLSAIQECKNSELGIAYPSLKDREIIADGGIRKPADFSKAMAAEANAIMIGGMLAGTDCAEDPTRYQGSAYKEKNCGNVSSEGAKFEIGSQKPTEDVLKWLEGGLRSAMAYTDSSTIGDFWSNAELIEVSSNCVKENGAHFGK